MAFKGGFITVFFIALQNRYKTEIETERQRESECKNNGQTLNHFYFLRQLKKKIVQTKIAYKMLHFAFPPAKT